MNNRIVHLGSTVSANNAAGAAANVASWISRRADLITAAAVFVLIYFLLIRKQ